MSHSLPLRISRDFSLTEIISPERIKTWKDLDDWILEMAKSNSRYISPEYLHVFETEILPWVCVYFDRQDYQNNEICSKVKHSVTKETTPNKLTFCCKYRNSNIKINCDF